MSIKTILLIVITAALAVQQWQECSRTPGIDFYHYWGVSKARQFSSDELPSPYLEQDRYATVLNTYAQGSTDARLKLVNQYRRSRFYVTGTPLFYSVFAALPTDYSLALGLFQTSQVLLFIASIAILGLSHFQHRWEVLVLAFLLIVAYGPLETDLLVGNFNSLQLFAVVVLTVFADYSLKRCPTDRALSRCVIFMCVLVFVTLLKPNVALVTLLLAVHIWVTHRTRVFVRALIAGGAFGAIVMALTCMQFGSWTIWLDWYRYLTSAGGEKLTYPVSKGNYATVLLVAEALNVSVRVAILMVGVVLVASLSAVLMFLGAAGRPFRQNVARACVCLFGDPQLCAAVGITVTLALSPLVWNHYYVLSLLPALWLLAPQHRGWLAGTAGGLSIILTSGIVIAILVRQWEAWRELWPYSCAIGWLPLWIGTLGILARRCGTARGPGRGHRGANRHPGGSAPDCCGP